MTPFDWLLLAVLSIATLLIIIDGWRHRPGPHDDEKLEPWIQVWPPDDTP
jgi:hypothetical protein